MVGTQKCTVCGTETYRKLAMHERAKYDVQSLIFKERMKDNKESLHCILFSENNGATVLQGLYMSHHWVGLIFVMFFISFSDMEQ